jgi:hypothetical protein
MRPSRKGDRLDLRKRLFEEVKGKALLSFLCTGQRGGGQGVIPEKSNMFSLRAIA